MTEWQPIETAPKNDGEHLLMHGDGGDFEDCTFVGWWSAHGSKWMPFDGYTEVRPTHWMPLPPPPTP